MQSDPIFATCQAVDDVLLLYSAEDLLVLVLFHAFWFPYQRRVPGLSGCFEHYTCDIPVQK